MLRRMPEAERSWHPQGFLATCRRGRSADQRCRGRGLSLAVVRCHARIRPSFLAPSPDPVCSQRCPLSAVHAILGVHTDCPARAQDASPPALLKAPCLRAPFILLSYPTPLLERTDRRPSCSVYAQKICDVRKAEQLPRPRVRWQPTTPAGSHAYI